MSSKTSVPAWQLKKAELLWVHQPFLRCCCGRLIEINCCCCCRCCCRCHCCCCCSGCCCFCCRRWSCCCSSYGPIYFKGRWDFRVQANEVSFYFRNPPSWIRRHLKSFVRLFELKSRFDWATFSWSAFLILSWLSIRCKIRKLRNCRSPSNLTFVDVFES